MTDKQYALCVEEAKHYTDRNAYISDLALSAIFAGDVSGNLPPDLPDKLGTVYDAYHRSVKDIAAAAGMSCRKLSERFLIPYRTVENWCGGQRVCPDYLRMMMQECLGLISR